MRYTVNARPDACIRSGKTERPRGQPPSLSSSGSQSIACSASGGGGGAAVAAGGGAAIGGWARGGGRGPPAAARLGRRDAEAGLFQREPRRDDSDAVNADLDLEEVGRDELHLPARLVVAAPARARIPGAAAVGPHERDAPAQIDVLEEADAPALAARRRSVTRTTSLMCSPRRQQLWWPSISGMSGSSSPHEPHIAAAQRSPGVAGCDRARRPSASTRSPRRAVQASNSPSPTRGVYRSSWLALLAREERAEQPGRVGHRVPVGGRRRVVRRHARARRARGSGATNAPERARSAIIFGQVERSPRR